MTAAIQRRANRNAGFTILELLVSLGVFLAICGAMFKLLNTSQKSYDRDTKSLGYFQDARLGLDQVVRDAEQAGYPPQNQFAITPTVATYASSPVAWSPNYPAAACTIGVTCITPGNFDVIFEEQPVTGGFVKWIRYQLVGTTLFRGAITKLAGDPNAPTSAAGVLLPYVTNVMNNAPGAQIAQYRADYPKMFAGGAQPIFQYYCDTPTTNPNGPAVLCSLAGADNSPANVRDIEINLIVLASQNDQQTMKPRLVQLQGRAHRVNPNQ